MAILLREPQEKLASPIEELYSNLSCKDMNGEHKKIGYNLELTSLIYLLKRINLNFNNS